MDVCPGFSASLLPSTGEVSSKRKIQPSILDLTISPVVLNETDALHEERVTLETVTAGRDDRGSSTSTNVSEGPFGDLLSVFST